MLKKAHTIVAPRREPVFQSPLRSMKVKLVRKYANVLNGIDLSHVRVGDVLELSGYHAALLVGEGWAEHAVTTAKRSDVESGSNTDAAEID